MRDAPLSSIRTSGLSHHRTAGKQNQCQTKQKRFQLHAPLYHGIERKRLETQKKKMAPQVGLEPAPEIAIAGFIVPTFPSDTRKINSYRDFDPAYQLPQNALKSLKS